jgi:putative endonuclease
MGWVYILKCADGSYYTGSTTNLERRLNEHQEGVDSQAYTYRRRPVELVWCCQCATIREAYQFEQKIKGWSRAKKEALIREDMDEIHRIVAEERKRRELERRVRG